jgi:uncharacterized membrane protein
MAQGVNGGAVERNLGTSEPRNLGTSEPRNLGTSPRVLSVDVLRGLVMVLMAIDHVRVYSGVPAGGPTAGLFFTRWVTHFCAPVFVFLAGTSAFLYGRQLGDTRALSRYLLTRGVILIVLELTIIRLSWTFSLASMTFLLAGVIWMLGWCMVLMSLLVRWPPGATAAFGLIVIFLQDALRLLDDVVPPSAAWVLQFLYLGGEVEAGGLTISVLYSIVPWIGVMAAGYAFGAVVVREPVQRDRFFWRLGLSATAVFLLVAGAAAFFGGLDEGPPAIFQVLNQRKYPASQLFLLMTLGPSIAFLAVADRARRRAVRVLATFGRVPMFYYLLHIPLIHALALMTWFLRDGSTHSDWFLTAPYVSVPPAQRWSLPLLYLVFAIAVVLLYFACRWFAEVKARGSHRWLRFV